MAISWATKCAQSVATSMSWVRASWLRESRTRYTARPAVRASVRGANPMTSAGTPIRDTAERDETKTMRSAPARPQEGLSSPPHGD